jgi:dynamin 1-like protein
MTQFTRDFVTSIEGTNVNISTKELSGSARVYYIFNDVFGNALASIEPTQALENQDICTVIRNSTGPRPSLFMPEVAFDLLVKPQIKLLEVPSLPQSCCSSTLFYANLFETSMCTIGNTSFQC